MLRTRFAVAIAAVACLALVACGRSEDGDDKSRAIQLSPTTPAGKTDESSIVWAIYRNVQTLDPLYSFDYPENTTVSLMCESVLRTAPDGAVVSGLAEATRPDATTLVLDIKPEAKFWDGKPVTAEDVVFSLERQRNPELAGFYGHVFTRVKSIEATGAKQVTIKLEQPDYWLDGELSSFPGVVIQKDYAEAEGKGYGTPSGGAMCTGAYELKSWRPGAAVVAAANTSYWDSSVEPKVGEITLRATPDQAAFTSAMTTGEVDGSYVFALSTLRQLEKSPKVAIHQGPGYSTDAFVVSSLKGALGDVKVRRALSLAVDRKGIIDSVYQGAALMPRWFSNPGTFGYGKDVFEEAYDEAPVLKRNVEAAKQLIDEAGAKGKTVTIGMSSALPNIAATAGAYQAAGKAIGLNMKLKSVSADNYINFFTDPQARAAVDGFMTVNYGDYADPAALLSTLVLPEGSQNFSGLRDAKLIALMEKARSTADEDERARAMIEVEKRVGELLPWIPNAQPNSVLALNEGLTGAVASFAYMNAPWANELGGK